MCKRSIQAKKEMIIKLNFVPALSFLQDPDSGSRQKFHIQLDPDSKHWCKCYLTLKPAMELGRLFWHVQRNPERCFRGYRYLTSVLLVVLIHHNEVFFRESEAFTAEWNLFENYLLKPAGIIWFIYTYIHLLRIAMLKLWYRGTFPVAYPTYVSVSIPVAFLQRTFVVWEKMS